jgi:hypothetical protein
MLLFFVCCFAWKWLSLYSLIHADEEDSDWTWADSAIIKRWVLPQLIRKRWCIMLYIESPNFYDGQCLLLVAEIFLVSSWSMDRNLNIETLGLKFSIFVPSKILNRHVCSEIASFQVAVRPIVMENSGVCWNFRHV